MKPSAMLSLALILFWTAGTGITPAHACGYGSPVSCDDTGSGVEDGAKYMLKRVATALAADKSRALGMFSRGEGGFRTADTYVFCVGSDGTMNAHPNPILQGHDALGLHDKTGNYFIKTMLETAKPGEVSVIRYLFPKPGSTVAVPKTTYYTKAGDQMCGVGVYDGDDGKSAKTATTQDRIVQLRQKLDGEMPESARADWTAFLEALNASGDEQSATMAEARKRLKAVELALSPAPERNASGDQD